MCFAWIVFVSIWFAYFVALKIILLPFYCTQYSLTRIRTNQNQIYFRQFYMLHGFLSLNFFSFLFFSVVTAANQNGISNGKHSVLNLTNAINCVHHEPPKWLMIWIVLLFFWLVGARFIYIVKETKKKKKKTLCIWPFISLFNSMGSKNEMIKCRNSIFKNGWFDSISFFQYIFSMVWCVVFTERKIL